MGFADDGKVAAHSGPPPAAAPATSPTEDAPQVAPATTTGDSSILPASHWQTVPSSEDDIDDDDFDDDGDSALGTVLSSTASLSSSILKYRNIHGRTFHSDIGKAEAWTPNDETQTESMDINHHLCTLVTDGKLHLAPIPDDIKKAIDIGTGTGIWAIDFADEHPGTEVIGTDVSPIQPGWVPPNLSFEIDDANQTWTWADDSFDYVHLRCMFGSIADWPALYREAFRVCKPGGWIEDHENSVKFDSDDGSVTEDSPMGQWTKVFWEGGKKFGRTFRVVEDEVQKRGMEEAGFVDVVVTEFKCPVGPWAKGEREKQLGLFAKLVLETDIEGYVLYMWSAVMGWTKEETQVYIAHLRRQLRDPNVHSWYLHRIVYARKPLTA
ncbi:S-adenosyl-L-methionine-dependent methyltransferase [Cercophora scortea]|uniref:S-adenosyl-L-methionine-dependent methyltransferase n=1 Tax=Cercophora scortea TaxID=314031 RepID=A0AAE0IDZ9_9PEZI|nr:S-adenosyl-L-methionine-dependent methyltransferase [Cercophora scortea]